MKPSRKRMVVTGQQGQLVLSLLERCQRDGQFDVIALGRPDLDLTQLDGIEAALSEARPDMIVSAAAYTAVDQAESDEETATLVNATAAGRVAATADRLGIPIVHLSTDYVFDGSKTGPYTESDPVNPIGAYGRSKLAGEQAVAAATANHAILRTAWVYSPFGRNFVKTMLRLAETRDRIGVVDDQFGNPTSALDIADGIFQVANNLLSNEAATLRGTFHLTAEGSGSWADFAIEIFSQSALHGGPVAKIDRIPASQYPTPARRPANSVLDCSLVQARHGVRLPNWKSSTAEIVARLVRQQKIERTDA